MTDAEDAKKDEVPKCATGVMDDIAHALEGLTDEIEGTPFLDCLEAQEAEERRAVETMSLGVQCLLLDLERVTYDFLNDIAEGSHPKTAEDAALDASMSAFVNLSLMRGVLWRLAALRVLQGELG